MNIMLISQCGKKALTETRRILDQFAERKGDRTWQTAITLEGLNTLRRLLRKTARRNTAVACHWIRGTNHSELMWIVGNLSRFNQQGTIPTNTTQRDILRAQDEHHWPCIEVLALLAGMAGLFHDIGKANHLFGNKLRGIGAGFEPYRHEWVSLRLFVAFVKGKSDREWLETLRQIAPQDEAVLLENLYRDGVDTDKEFEKPFSMLANAPVARCIAWLIVSHHRLPVFPGWREEAEGREPAMTQLDTWMEKNFEPCWNAYQSLDRAIPLQQRQENWQFPQGTPLRSSTWRQRASALAEQALQHNQLHQCDWHEKRFITHFSRLVLMLADHLYSSLPPREKWQDKTYQAMANTDRKTGAMRQRLDEHNIGVAHYAQQFARLLPQLRRSLPALGRHKDFRQRAGHDRFRWQDKAFDLAVSLREQTRQCGFFGVNMASTGRGKTLANARIMYALSDEKPGCRFTVAVGLRTLTLQTGDALREKLHLQDDDLAVLIGSEAVRALHGMPWQTGGEIKSVEDEESKTEKMLSRAGSESLDSLYAEHSYVKYEGTLDDSRLGYFLQNDKKLHRLLSAPVLVSTIDHLMPATEGTRGGKQIVPMLRLLTSDLILDEPDDFDLTDLPALCRLVNWAGLAGSRVLLSSATLPPALITALFEAYRQGWQAYCEAKGLPFDGEISCAWFDEYNTLSQTVVQRNAFEDAHGGFVARRVENIRQQDEKLCWARLEPVSCASMRKPDVVNAVADVIANQIVRLHQNHYEVHKATGKRVSVGVVRIANIDPLVALAKVLLQRSAPENCRIHYCIYHSRFPLVSRSWIESKLDAVLKRDPAHPEYLWQQPEISDALKNSPEPDQIFVVLGSPVVEVGRDHDYDWAVVEPSSLRSLIQLAGRIQRHRRKVPASANMVILSKNFKAMFGDDCPYSRPGFETRSHQLKDRDLFALLPETCHQQWFINALPRIQQPDNLVFKPTYSGFVQLEHFQLRKALFGDEKEPLHANASRWWLSAPDWCAELQRRTPFRKSEPEQTLYLFQEDEIEPPQFCVYDEVHASYKPSDKVEEQSVEPAAPFWLLPDVEQLYQHLSEREKAELAQVSARFGEIHLRQEDKNNPRRYYYHPGLGVFHELK